MVAAISTSEGGNEAEPAFGCLWLRRRCGGRFHGCAGGPKKVSERCELRPDTPGSSDVSAPSAAGGPQGPRRISAQKMCRVKEMSRLEKSDEDTRARPMAVARVESSSARLQRRPPPLRSQGEPLENVRKGKDLC